MMGKAGSGQADDDDKMWEQRSWMMRVIGKIRELR